MISGRMSSRGANIAFDTEKLSTDNKTVNFTSVKIDTEHARLCRSLHCRLGSLH